MSLDSKKEKQAGFTLIELLGVLTVMAILMAITVPTFKGLTSGYSMKAAVNQVRGDLSLARQYAMLNNTRVVFLVPEYKHISTFPADGIDKCVRAYAVYDDTNKKYITPWRFLPEGIVFDCDSGMITAPSGIGTYDNFVNYTTTVNVSFPDETGGNKSFVCLDFLSDGTCSITTPVVIYLTEAKTFWPASGGAVNPTDKSQYLPKANATTSAIIVYTTSGRFEVVDDV